MVQTKKLLLFWFIFLRKRFPLDTEHIFDDMGDRFFYDFRLEFFFIFKILESVQRTNNQKGKLNFLFCVGGVLHVIFL